MPDDTAPIILFDGVCSFCHASVRFVIKHEHKASFSFAPLQSDFGQHLVKELSSPQPIPDSILVYTEGKLLFRSDAVLFIATRLTYPWKLFGLFRIVPHSIRDWIYDNFAKHRYCFFQQQDTCPIFPPETHDRFLDNSENKFFPAENSRNRKDLN